ncbi:MAG: hypothetical protein ABMA02_15995 [Saprospiraceae bacterium]
MHFSVRPVPCFAEIALYLPAIHQVCQSMSGKTTFQSIQLSVIRLSVGTVKLWFENT